MWRTDTLWVDVAIVMSMFAIGNILLNRMHIILWGPVKEYPTANTA